MRYVGDSVWEGFVVKTCCEQDLYTHRVRQSEKWQTLLRVEREGPSPNWRMGDEMRIKQ